MRTLGRCVGIIAVWAAGLHAQAVDSTDRAATRLIGVYDALTGEPLANVRVRDAFSGAFALTTPTGTARLDFVTYRGGAALVQLTRLGYDAKTLVLKRGDTTPITETLDRVTTLAPMVTRERYLIDRDAGRRDGFDQRCTAKSVTCFREQDLTGRGTTNLADFLMHAPGVLIGPCGPGRNSQCGKAAMRSSVIPPSYCEPSIFVDGFLWNPRVGTGIDLVPNTPPTAPFTAANIVGMEVYPTEAGRPLRFEGDPMCGAIVIWTK